MRYVATPDPITAEPGDDFDSLKVKFFYQMLKIIVQLDNKIFDYYE